MLIVFFAMENFIFRIAAAIDMIKKGLSKLIGSC